MGDGPAVINMVDLSISRHIRLNRVGEVALFGIVDALITLEEFSVFERGVGGDL